MPRDGNIEKRKADVRRSYTSYVLCQPNLLGSTASYILFIGRKSAKVCRELSQTVLAKRTQETSDSTALGLIVTAEEEELVPQKLQP